MADVKLFVEIQKKYPAFELNVSFTSGNEALGVLGASGSGKSMTLRCIAGLETPDKGRIILNDRVLFDSEKKINLPSKIRNIGFLFQHYALFPHMTVAQNIAFGLSNLSKKERALRVAEKIAMARLEGFADRYPHQLSGGQQQRAALARALAAEPDALMLDEPFSALDNHLRSEMEKELIEVLNGFSGVTLFVTHNLDEAYRVCQDLIIIDNGKKIAQGEKEELFKNPPNYASAKVTGCKNISTARAVDSNTIEAVDWGYNLKVSRPLPANLAHVGIRAHHLNFVDNSDQENVFPCWLTHTSKTPHRITLYLTLNFPPGSSNSCHLQAEVSKEKWEIINDRPFPWLVHLEPNRLFLTNEL